MANTIEIIINTKANTGGVQNVLGALGSLGKLSLAGVAAGAAAAGGALAALGVSAVRAGADAEEMLGKFNTVFRDLSGPVTDALGDFAEQVGRKRFELLGFAATFQDTFVPLGFARDEAAEMSVQLVKLAADLGSFNNVAEADVVRDLQSALVGNTETLRKYGVVASQAAIEQYALEQGLWDGTDALTAQEKAAAILGLTIAGTADAQGDAARTSTSWTNTMRALKSELAETATEIGLKLLPVITPFLRQLTQGARDILPRLAGGLGTVLTALEKFGISGAFDVLGVLLRDVFPGAEGPLRNVGRAIESIVNAVRLLATGDFQGGIFGLMEDDPFILGLIKARDTVLSIFEAVRTVITGDFRGGIFGLMEDDPAVLALLRVHRLISEEIPAALAALSSGEAAAGLAALIPPEIMESGQRLADALRASIPDIQAAGGEIAASLTAAGEQIAETWDNVMSSVGDSDAGNNLVSALAGTLDLITGLWEAHGGTLIGIVTTISTTVNQILGDGISLLIGILGAALTIITGTWQATIQVLTGDWQGAWDTIIGAVADAMEAILTSILDAGPGMAGAGAALMDSLKAGIASKVAELIAYAQQVIGQVVGAFDVGSGGGYPGVTGQPRQHGGPVQAGQLYVVGERGPEFFVPAVNGAIVPNGAIGSGGAVGGNTYVTVEPGAIQVAPASDVDAELTAVRIARHIWDRRPA